MLVKSGPLSLDQAIGDLAARQYGVVAARQLRALGVTSQAISLRARNGRMHRVHQGVYAVGHRLLTVRGRWMAAVLAGGPGAVLSHASAGALWELRRSSAALIDVTTRRTGRARPGLRIHRPRTLRPDETTTKDGIPVTTPRPEVNTTVQGKEVDFLFAQHRVIVETDSWRYHKTCRAFEEDRARDVLTTSAGYRTLRFTDRRLTNEPHAVAAAIHRLLADRRAA